MGAVWVAVAVLAAVGAAVVAWGLFEAGWLRTRVVEVEVPGVPAALDGLRIAHLSDFHLGPRSRGERAVRRGVAWASARGCDVVAVTGDLLSRPRGHELLHELVEQLGRPFVVLGNHDVALTRDPFSRTVELDALEGAAMLHDVSETLELRGCRVQIAGVDPRTYVRQPGAAPAPDPDAQLRILLCHFPGIARRLPAGAFDLVLAGHLHAGQIVLPYPGGRLTLAHPRAQEVSGLYRCRGGLLHVSPGLGTTFLPLRLFARPEATELVVRSR
jgi:hypothetical protein